MKLNLTAEKIAKITGGKLVSSAPQTKITAFVTDSRVVSQGDGFIALKGNRFDAHQFIADVLKKGAAVVVANKTYKVPSGSTASFILVDDTLKALQTIAKYHRQNSKLKVAAITGSNGKSTTKQMLRAICSCAGETIANMGNFNNQFGVPFSLLEIQSKHMFGVFELGASHPGDIAETAALTLPDVAVLTNISAAHMEFFHDLETVYQTKTEIIRYLNPGATVVYNQDDTYLARLKTQLKGKGISFGFSEEADVHILPTEKFTFTYKDEAYVFDLQLEQHNKLNAAAACAAALALGIDIETIKKGLSSFTPMPMRMERISKGNTTFILDCYNANPASMKNALSILGKETRTPRIAVLGDMKELGETSKEYHRLVASQLLDNHIDTIFLAGEEMKYAYEKLREIPSLSVYYAATPDKWIKTLSETVKKKGGTCLMKASRSMNFETIFKEI